MKRYRMILKAHNFSKRNLMRKYDEMLYLQHKMIYNHKKRKMFVSNIIEIAFNRQCISSIHYMKTN